MSRTNEPPQNDGNEEDLETVQLLSRDADSGAGAAAAVQQHSPRRNAAAAFVKSRLGLLMALAGTLTFSLMTVCVRLVPRFGPPVPVFFIVVIRGCIVTASSLWSLWRRGVNPLGPRPYFGWLVFRGSMGFTALSSYYYGLYHLRVADAVVLQKTCPVLVCIIAALWLKEKFSMYDISASMLCLGGVIMVVQSEDRGAPEGSSPMTVGNQELGGVVNASVVSLTSKFDWEGAGAVLVTLGSALSSAFAYVTIRKLKTDARGLAVDPMVLVLYFAFICVPGETMLLLLLSLKSRAAAKRYGNTVLFVYLFAAIVNTIPSFALWTGGLVGLYLGEDEVPWSDLTAEQMVIIVFGCGMLGFVGQTLLNSSFQRESAVSHRLQSLC
jgi:drug/metabolite transporter (DMT)-like permease